MILHAMGQVLRYDFDPSQDYKTLKRSRVSRGLSALISFVETVRIRKISWRSSNSGRDGEPGKY
ncbi:protein of unknown function [Methylocaldum szegediense]|uniref:Uncharacterized protein n=1 Tax=Methylocaldum szegediense TaxID=73780 RepID=A0ABN8XA77_9GAMM|nr:protein of unknown function [Methylocaldum szegediense]